MRSWIKTLLIILFLTVVFHLIFISIFPNAMMYVVLKILMGDREVNKVYHRLPEPAGKDRVPMTSPNLLKSSCIYDVSAKPLRIRAVIPDTYWSISFYATNTDNFYVLNDEQVSSNQVELVLMGPDTYYKKSRSEDVVVAPSSKGYILIRMLITDRNRLRELRKIQKLATFELE